MKALEQRVFPVTVLTRLARDRERFGVRHLATPIPCAPAPTPSDPDEPSKAGKRCECACIVRIDRGKGHRTFSSHQANASEISAKLRRPLPGASDVIDDLAAPDLEAPLRTWRTRSGTPSGGSARI